MCYHVFNQWRNAHEKEQRTQSGAETNQSENMRNVWWDKDPAETSQGWGCHEQCERQSDCPLSEVPHDSPHAQRYMGQGQSEAGNLQDMRNDIPTETGQAGEVVREARMHEGERATISRVAVGVKNRVDRLKAIGNGQVPAVASLAWEILTASNEGGGK